MLRKLISFLAFSQVLGNDRGQLFEGEGDDGKGDDGKGGEGGDDGKGDEGKEGKDGKGGAADTVSRADHDRALADLQKFKKEAKALADEKKKAADQKLKDENNWKALAEANELKAKEADDRSEKLQTSFLEGKKFDAVRLACEKLNLRAEAVGDLDVLDLKDVVVETTSTGKINVLGADKFADRLKTLKPHWFEAKGKPNVNTRGTGVRDSDGPITPQKIYEAEKAGRKSGDMSSYNEMFMQFQKQRAAARR